MSISHVCDCGTTVEGADLAAFGDAFIAHARAGHPEWPYPDTAIRNYAEATQRLTGPTERLDEIGRIEVHPVDEDRIGDWLGFFDHDAFADNPAWAACYCSEPHRLARGAGPDGDPDVPWQERRALMIDLLRAGRSFGYLAYVDGRAAGWVNASKRSEYALYRQGPDADPPDPDVIGISCFAIAPPYRRHGLASALLDRVIADAPARGVGWIEAYPFDEPGAGDASNFRGPHALFEQHGFAPVGNDPGSDGRHTVVRRPVPS